MKNRILFVDDEQEVLDGFRRSLHDHTDIWDMIFATSVEEAVEHLNKKLFDVVVLDVKMPGYDGFELLSNIKKDDRNRGIQIIVLTGLLEQDLKRKALDLGATDLLTKPIQKEELLTRINSVLRIKSYYDSLQNQNAILKDQLIRSQRMELVGVLAGGAVHDLNNIFTLVQGYSELASHDLKDYTRIRKNLGIINNSIDRASRIVGQILNFVKQPDMLQKHCDIGEIISESLELLRATVPSEIIIEFVNNESTHQISADPTQIYQMLMNLFINAIQAMDGKGTLKISFNKINQCPGSLTTGNKVYPGSYLKLEVFDTGTGIDQATIEHIFDPLYTTKLSRGGTGLGLSVIKQIVQNHKGLINVESKPGEGTTFSVYLPYQIQGDGPSETFPEGV